MKASHALRLAWQSCLVLALLLSPLSMAWAGDAVAPPAGTAHSNGCHEGMPGMPTPTPSKPHPALPGCVYACVGCAVMVLAPTWHLPPVATLELFPDPFYPHVDRILDVELRPPIG